MNNSKGEKRSCFIDLTGKRFGKLVAKEYLGVPGSKWLVRCDCGNEKSVRGHNLRSGDTVSCGCLHDKTGRRYGRLVVQGWSELSKKWNCICDCGEIADVKAGALNNGNTRSCGCLKIDVLTTHGGKGKGWYKSWKAMMARCYDQENVAYSRYGEKGIKVCGAWHDAGCFHAAVGERPDGCTIDRYPDQGGDYEPGNVRWATIQEQAENRKTTKLDRSTVFAMRAMWMAGCPIGDVIQHLAPSMAYSGAHMSVTGKKWKSVPWPTEDEIQAILDGEEVDMQRFAA